MQPGRFWMLPEAASYGCAAPLETRIQSVKFQDILDTLFQDILDSFGVCKERVESGFWEYLGGG
jgi:hypothetical protein